MKMLFNWSKNNNVPHLDIEILNCLSKSEAEELKKIDLNSLIHLEKEERIKALSCVVDNDRLEWLNSVLEKEFIVKPMQKVLIDMFREEQDIELKYRNEIERRISLLEKPLNDQELESFIKEMMELRYGIGLTEEEIKILESLVKKVNDAELEIENEGNNSNYIIAKNNLDDYVKKMKGE